MKRSPLKRGTKRLRAKKPLKRGSGPKRSPFEAFFLATPNAVRDPRRTPLRKVGRRGRAIRRELDKLRPLVFERDGHVCRYCLDPRCLPLEAHHRRSRARGGEHTLDNLVTLGAPHHKLITAHAVPDWRNWLDTGKKPSR